MTQQELENYELACECIKKYESIDALKNVAKIIDNSRLPEEVMKQLHVQLNCRIANIQGKPYFSYVGDNVYLMNEKGSPRIFTYSFGAVVVATVLRMKGHRVKIVGNSFFKIALEETVPAENHELINS